MTTPLQRAHRAVSDARRTQIAAGPVSGGMHAATEGPARVMPGAWMPQGSASLAAGDPVRYGGLDSGYES